MTIDHGGWAFPGENDHNKFYNWVNKGMTLRDYFAGQALAGICANPEWKPTDLETVAADAYAHADAMITKRGSD